MATLIGQLQREADDFCGHRGLQPESDDQVSRGLIWLGKKANNVDLQFCKNCGQAARRT